MSFLKLPDILNDIPVLSRGDTGYVIFCAAIIVFGILRTAPVLETGENIVVG